MNLLNTYIPKPMQCLKCQFYGHSRNYCRRPTETCARCGEEGHRASVCCNPYFCINCGGCHSAMNKKCEYFQYKSEITATQIKMKVLYQEAVQIVNERFRSENKRFNFVVRKPNASQEPETQTPQTDKAATPTPNSPITNLPSHVKHFGV